MPAKQSPAPKALWKMRPMPTGEKPVIATARIPLNTALLQLNADNVTVLGDALVDQADHLIRGKKPALTEKGLEVYGAEIALDGQAFKVTLAYLPEDVTHGAIAEIFE